jgi:hypothetical protein
MPGEIALDQSTLRGMQERAARKVFRVQVAMGVIGNEGLMKLADRTGMSNEGQRKAEQLRNRCLSIIQSYLDEED